MVSIRIDHIAIWTKDLERLKGFYRTYFQAVCDDKYVNQDTRFESYFLTFGTGARLELMSMPGIPETKNDAQEQFTGLVHFAIATGSTEQVDRLTLWLEQDGYRVLDGPRFTGDGYYESVILDPDGNRVEITA